MTIKEGNNNNSSDQHDKSESGNNVSQESLRESFNYSRGEQTNTITQSFETPQRPTPKPTGNDK